MAATIKQISELTGLSTSTVVQVLGNRGHRYRKETKERVLQAARDHNYRPNSSARAMRTGQFGAVALLMSVGGNSYLPSALLDGIQDALTERNLHLTVAKLPDDQLLQEGVVPHILRQWLADGLLINYNENIPSRFRQLIADYQVPSIWINSQQDGDCVYSDDFTGGREATECLLQLGHSRIAYVDYSHQALALELAHYSARDRHQGYEAAMHGAGLSTRSIFLQAETPPAEWPSVSRGWLDDIHRPTAVVTYSPYTAGPIYVAAVAHLSLQVPGDLSIVTFADTVWDVLGIDFTTAVLQQEKIGRAAAAALQQKIIDQASPQPPCRIPICLVEGQTTSSLIVTA